MTFCGDGSGFDEFALIDSEIGRRLAEIGKFQLGVAVRSDMAEFCAHRSSFGEGYAHPAFDPARSAIWPGDAYWLEIRNGRNDVIGVAASRLFRNERLCRLLQSRAIWSSLKPDLRPAPPIRLELGRETMAVAGNLVFSGGLYLKREYRSHKTGGEIVKLMRALSARHWSVDFIFGMQKAQFAKEGLPISLYGYPRSEPCFSGGIENGPVNSEEWLSWMSLSEILSAAAKGEQASKI